MTAARAAQALGCSALTGGDTHGCFPVPSNKQPPSCSLTSLSYSSPEGVWRGCRGRELRGSRSLVPLVPNISCCSSPWPRGGMGQGEGQNLNQTLPALALCLGPRPSQPKLFFCSSFWCFGVRVLS